MKVNTHAFTLKLKNTFTISRGARDSVDSMIVTLSENGLVGYGEATANPYYRTTVMEMSATIDRLRPLIEQFKIDSPTEFWNYLYPHLKNEPFVLCALDQAMYDLTARKSGKALYDFWGLENKNLPLTNYTIGIASIEEMVEKMKAQPWPIYKIKLGTDRDMEIVAALRKHTDAVFRIDANCGWTADETIARAPQLKTLGVEMIEQPLPANNLEGMKKVFAESVLPIFADESCCVENDVDKCVGLFHGVNIKLMKCGGVTPALRMIKNAKAKGLKVMMGCMTESSVGISMIAQFLPLLDYVDMDGALLIANDPADGVGIEDGVVSYAKTSGTGVSFKKNSY